MSSVPLQRLFRELKRRKVFRVVGVYAVVAWVLIEVADTVAPLMAMPPWAPKIVVFLALFGFPVAIVLAWALEVTPEGVRRTDAPTAPGRASPSGRNRLAGVFGAGLLVVLAGFGAYAYLGPEPDEAGPKGPITSIAVLPFADMSAKGDQEYFGDGMAEELLDALAQVEGLRVPARTSSFQFKGESVDIREAARKLNVEAVLEGSVRKDGDRVRITVQLIEADSGYHLWSESYDRSLTDIFAVQDEISREIVRALRLRLTDEDRDGIASTGTQSVLAYELYLRGKDYFRKMAGSPKEGDNHTISAITLLREATREDPQYAAAWAGLARGYVRHPDLSREERTDSLTALAREAIRLDPSLPDGYLNLGVAYWRKGDPQAALKQWRYATELNPNHALAADYIAAVHLRSGRIEEAIRSYRQAVESDPAWFRYYDRLADTYARLGLFERADEWTRRGGAGHPARAQAVLGKHAQWRGDRDAVRMHADSQMALAPDVPYAWYSDAGLRSYLGEYEEAQKQLQRYAATLPSEDQPLIRLAYLAQQTGDPEGAERLLREAEAHLSQEIGEVPEMFEDGPYSDLARVQAVRGELEAAMESLAHTVGSDRGWSFYYELRTEPEYETLQGYPPFERLMSDLKQEVDRMRERVLQARL